MRVTQRMHFLGRLITAQVAKCYFVHSSDDGRAMHVPSLPTAEDVGRPTEYDGCRVPISRHINFALQK